MSPCRHPDCTAPATAQVTNPFGRANVCGQHAAEVTGERTSPGWWSDLFRAGPFLDQPLDPPTSEPAR
jgi:hypothetical protein